MPGDSAAAGAPPQSILSSSFYRPGGGTWFSTQEDETKRGPLILGSPDIRLQMRASDRTCMALQSRVLAENFGPGGCLWNLAGMIGSMRARSAGGDPGYDRIVDAYYASVVDNPLLFDVAGGLTLSTYQPIFVFQTLRDGDAFSVFSESYDGAHGAVAGYDGLCVENPRNATASDRWFDGILTNANRFPLEFNFVERSLMGGMVTDKPLASRAVYHHRIAKGFGAARGIPCLSHALNDFRDLIETKGFLKTALKLAAMIGLTPHPTVEAQQGASPFPQGIAGPVYAAAVPTTPPDAPVTAPPTEPQRYTFEQAIAGGITSTKSFDVVHDDRPHPNGREFRQDLLRETAIGCNMPPQILFFMDDPSGTFNRTLLELTANTIFSYHRDLLVPFLRRHRLWVIARGLKAWKEGVPDAGIPPRTVGIPPSPAGYDFAKARLTPPRSFTVDAGRMGRIAIEMRKYQMSTLAMHYEGLGVAWEEAIDQIATEIAYCRMKEETTPGLRPGDLTDMLLGISKNTAPGAGTDPAAQNRLPSAA